MLRSTVSLRLFAFSCALAVSAVCASAQVTYTGEDLNAGPGDSHPVSAAAQASFLSSASVIGTPSTITFESSPIGTFTSLSVAPGVTMTGSTYQGASQSVNNTPNFPGNPALDGFNTTSGGNNYVEMQGGTLTFSFATPIQFFGAYLTGVQTSFFQDNITFSDGSSETVDIPGAGTNSDNGALDFVGFTDAGESISSVTINAGSAETGADFIGVDDVIYGPTAASTTPEPSSLMLLGTGLFGAAVRLRGRFKR